MVRYYGRARQRININRKQVGIKMAGCLDGRGRPSWMTRYIKSRVNCNTRVGCVDSNGDPTYKMRTYDKQGNMKCVANHGYLLITEAPRSRACAGGVYMLSSTKCR
jgi:hypothetical protein